MNRAGRVRRTHMGGAPGVRAHLRYTMLQIISGKFFTSRERHVFEAKGITYGNFSWVAPIETCVATLEPVGGVSTGISPYVISYTNQIEKEEGARQASLVRTGDAEIVQQFECIATFGLGCLFGTDRWEIEFACRSQPKDSSDSFVPQHFVPRFFSPSNMGKAEEVERFVKLVKKIIGLPRKKYAALLTSLETLRHSLLVLSHNVDMAYSLLVYCLESLSQGFDGFQPVWDDYDEAVRGQLAPVLAEIDQGKAQQIRSTLVGAAQLRLQKRFTEFIATHISETFYIDEAKGRQQAVRPSELRRALQNTYYMRSGYVHMLKPIPSHLRVLRLADSDVFRWGAEPHLTFSGLLRVARHTIAQFIERGKYVEREDYDWRQDLPGIITLKMAPQYWIWRADGFRPEHAHQRLSGFLAMFQEYLTDNKALTDLTDLMGKYEQLLPTAKKDDKVAMLSLYALFNRVADEERRSPRYEEMMKQHGSLLDECRIETVVVRMLIEESLPWSAEEVAEALDGHRSGRFAKKAVHVPVLIEVALAAWIANEHLNRENNTEYDRWSHIALLEATGIQDVQDHIRDRMSRREAFDSVWIATRGRMTSEQPE